MSHQTERGASAPGDVSNVFGGGGETGALMRALDWAATPVGPVEQWPQALRTAVRIMLTSRYAMWMGWGPDLTFFYNDAYARMTLGRKHPWALGRSAREVWAEIWPDIGPRIERVLTTGEATWDEALKLFLERSGYPEETYHTFSYSPLADDAGRISGMLCVVTEETERVIGERRLALLREVAADLAATQTPDDVLEAVRACFEARSHDLPFTLTYIFEPDGSARLACATGVPEGRPLAAVSLPPGGAGSPWPVAELVAAAGPLTVNDLPNRFPNLPTGPWDRPPQQAAVAPIARPGQDRPAGFLVAGINPYRPFDTDYAGFIGLLAGQLSSSLANARAWEEERRRAEALAELDRAKTTFFTNISHELRTPLTLMLGPVDDILAKPEAEVLPDNREQLAVVRRNGRRLLKLVNTLLDFSRIEARRVQAAFEPTDLAAVTADLASVFRSAIERAGLRYVVDCPPLPQPVYVDREMWEKVVLNLLSNAFKFTVEGEIAVRLRAEGDHIELRVSDTGVGVPAAEVPRLFERFHRVEGSRGRTHEGTGIGLALVQELVKQHGGSVRAESVEGEGTTFTVTLPFGTAHLPPERIGAASTLPSTAVGAEVFAAEAEQLLGGDGRTAETVEPAQAAAPAAALPARAFRVLVADDNADMRAYVARLLSDQFEVEAVADGEAALAAARARRPDLVLSDVMMPRLDGFGLLRALREDAATATVPVILLSARAGEEARVEGLEAGADEYLVKPFSARELIARVSALLLRTQVRDESRRILETITDGFIALDRDWRFTYVNAEAERLNGLSRAEMIGRNHWEVFAATVGTTVYDEFHRCVREQTPVAFENYYAPWDRWFELRAFPAPDGGLSAYFRDITERKRADVALRQRTAQFETLLNGAPVGIYLVGADFRIREVNPAALPTFGDIPGGVIGRDFDEIIHLLWEKSYADEVVRIFRHTLETGESYMTAERAEYRIDRGVIEHYEWRLDRITLPDGRYGLVCYFRDISEQVQARQAIERSEERFRALVTASSDVVYCMSPDWTEMRFLEGREFIADTLEPSRTWLDKYIHPDDQPRVIEAIAGAIRGKRIFTLEHRVLRPDGTLGWTFSRAAPILDAQGNIVEWFGMASDVTRRRQDEEERERHLAQIESLNSRLKRAMTETHHRVKNNLQLISALIELQAMEHETAATAAEFTRLNAHVRTMANVHDILTHESKRDSQTTTVSAKAVLERMVPMLQGIAGDDRLRARIEDVVLPAKHATSLALVTNELVLNALKHGDGDVEVDFRVRDGHAELVVSDDGPGFPQGFDPEQAASTGLQLVESVGRWDLGGGVRFENRPGGNGARVVVTIPLSRLDQSVPI